MSKNQRDPSGVAPVSGNAQCEPRARRRERDAHKFIKSHRLGEQSLSLLEAREGTSSFEVSAGVNRRYSIWSCIDNAGRYCYLVFEYVLKGKRWKEATVPQVRTSVMDLLTPSRASTPVVA